MMTLSPDAIDGDYETERAQRRRGPFNGAGESEP
jgi:hypothetical protein